ncbi:MAG: hypothetical protein AAFX78_18375 [Cyanobacteria bacterium J06638_20]
MPIEMNQFTIRFDPEAGEPRRETDTVPLDTTVRQAAVCLVGWEAKFEGQDRELHHIRVDVDMTSFAGTVSLARLLPKSGFCGVA